MMKLFFSALTASIIAGGGALLTAMSDGGALSINVLVAAGVVAMVAGAKDYRTFLAKSPKE